MPPVLKDGALRSIVLTANTTWYLRNFRLGLIRALLAGGCEVSVWAPEDDSSAVLADAGVKLVHLPINGKGLNPLEDMGLLRTYGRLLRDSCPDALLAFTIKPVIYGGLAAQRAGIPYLSTITGLGTAFIREGWLTRIAEILYRRSQRNASNVFFQNRDDLALFTNRRIVDAHRTVVVPGSGINLEHFKPLALPSKHIGQATFLMIGRMLRDKGVQEFVDAARLLHKDFPQARFQLLGAADTANRTAISRAQLLEWQAEGIVEYLGQSGDIRREIAEADCIVLPSYREGMPRVLLEGAAMGRPLLATDVPGCREIVVEGVNGYLCPARTASGLAAVMRQIAEMEPAQREALGAAARGKVERDYDERIVIDHYLAAMGIGNSTAGSSDPWHGSKID